VFARESQSTLRGFRVYVAVWLKPKLVSHLKIRSERTAGRLVEFLPRNAL